MRWLHILLLVSVLFFTHQPSQIAKNIGSMSIRYRSDAKVSDRCLIDVDPTVFAIWAVGRYIIAELIWACDSFKDLYDSHFQIIMLLTFTFLLGIHLFFTSFCILTNYQLFKRRYILIGCIRQFDWWTFETSLFTTNGERECRKVDIYISSVSWMTWKLFPHYWPFVTGHRWIPSQRIGHSGICCSFNVRLKMLLSIRVVNDLRRHVTSIITSCDVNHARHE